MKKQEKLYTYSALSKGDKFSMGILGKPKNYIKFNNAWARDIKSGDWIAMLSTESVTAPLKD